MFLQFSNWNVQYFLLSFESSPGTSSLDSWNRILEKHLQKLHLQLLSIQFKCLVGFQEAIGNFIRHDVYGTI